MSTYISSKEANALHEAIDFISSNSDGADDTEMYETLCGTLRSLWHKAKKDISKREHKILVKKALRILKKRKQ